MLCVCALEKGVPQPAAFAEERYSQRCRFPVLRNRAHCFTHSGFVNEKRKGNHYDKRYDKGEEGYSVYKHTADIERLDSAEEVDQEGSLSA